MSIGDHTRNSGLRLFVLLVFAMFAFAMVAGRPNQGLLELSYSGRQVFGCVALAGFFLLLYLMRFFPHRRTVTFTGLRKSMICLAITFAWVLACFLCIHRTALLLDGPVSTQPASLQRPLFPGPPLWCSQFTAVRTEDGRVGSLCTERLGGRSEFMPLLGCVPLDTPASIQVRETYLGPVVSLVDVTDVDGKCAKKGSVR